MVDDSEPDTRKSVGELAASLKFGNARIRRERAIAMKRTDPLPVGRCSLCGGYNGELYAFAGTLCSACYDRGVNNGGQMKVLYLTLKPGTCDACYRFVGKRYVVNPRACNKCLQRIARRNKFDCRPAQQPPQPGRLRTRV